MPRFVVGTGQRCPMTEHLKIALVAKRVNWLVYLGYQGILITDKESGWKCIANGKVTAEQLTKALHADEVSIAHLLKRREYQKKQYRKDKER
jgi:hypothetical protein